MSSFKQGSLPQVLVVGAGPTGLTLALTLLRNGVSVRVIDKNEAPNPGQRGSGIYPRTLEVLEALGLFDQVKKFSMAVPQIRVYEGTKVIKEADMITQVLATPDRPHPNGIFLGQNHLESILAEAVVQHGGIIDRGIEFEALEQGPDSVRVTLRILNNGDDKENATYGYVAGADGGKGTMRKALGIPFVGETHEDTQVVFGDFYIEGLSQDRIHVWGDVFRNGVLVRPTETPGLYSIVLGGETQKYINSQDQIESVREILKKATGGREDVHIVKSVWHGIYRFNIRMTPQFSKGRVFLGGDASHVHSPTGGQGLNTGVQDSFNLGWKLALVINGHAPVDLLDTYSAERVPIVAEMLNITTELLNQTLATRTDVSNDNVLARGGKLNQLGINYRTSRIVIDDGERVEPVSGYGGPDGGPVRAGDRAPDAPGLVKIGTETPKRLFEIFDLRLHVVIIFSHYFEEELTDTRIHALSTRYSAKLVRFVVILQAGADATTTALGSEFAVYEDRDGHAYKAYGNTDGSGKIFVIRPDGYVGARLRELEGVDSYFTNVFGGK